MAQIESSLQAVVDTLRVVAESEARTQKALSTVAASQAETNKALGEVAQALTQITQSTSDFAESAKNRISRIEESLQDLIRLIAAEHSNGKTKH